MVFKHKFYRIEANFDAKIRKLGGFWRVLFQNQEGGGFFGGCFFGGLIFKIRRVEGFLEGVFSGGFGGKTLPPAQACFIHFSHACAYDFY